MTKEGLAERDRMVLSWCRGASLPVVITMSGGYARNIQNTVDIHFQTIQLAVGIYKAEQRAKWTS